MNRFMLLSAALATLTLGASQAHAGPMNSTEGGFGFNIGGAGAPVESTYGEEPGIGSFGLQGFRVYDQKVRVGGEANFMSGAMTGGSAGVFTDFILASPGNVRFYAGLGTGVGGATVQTAVTDWSGSFVYLKPEIGMQINLGRAAAEIELAYTAPLTGGLMEAGYPGHVGLSFGMAFGNFPILQRRAAPAPVVRRAPPPPIRRAPPPPVRRTPPPPYRSSVRPPPPPSRHSSANNGYGAPPPPKKSQSSNNSSNNGSNNGSRNAPPPPGAN